jgi:hypothetical protein
VDRIGGREAATAPTVAVAAEGPTATAIRMMAESQADLARALSHMKRKGYNSGSSSAGSRGRGKFSHPVLLRRRVNKQPEKTTNRWLAHVKEELSGGQGGNRWNLSLYNQHLRRSFGQNTPLYRTHHLLSAALDVILIEGRLLPGLAMLVQALQAIHQAGVDNGRWQKAYTFTMTPDILGVAEFAGDPRDVDTALTYQKIWRTSVPRPARAVGNGPRRRNYRGGKGDKGKKGDKGDKGKGDKAPDK